MKIPLEPDFTVVTGPNGSGKSNILDGVLFCLGLATSRGMRADRLPDLVNSGVLKAGKSAETVVSVRFDLSDWSPDAAEEGLEPPEEGPWIKPDQKDWTVTRRLRVMPGGSYSSSYSADGEPCNLQQLQTQLRRLRIDPEGSNVVMQGDVTRIVSMSNRDRRGLIDELAGVALFDNRIEQTRAKLDDVHDRQERCRIVEQELISSRQRLEKDSHKASLYKDLKEQFRVGKDQELVLDFYEAQKKVNDLNDREIKLDKQEVINIQDIEKVQHKLDTSLEELKLIQKDVKLLGEDKLLSVQAEIAGLDAQNRELERQKNNHKQEGESLHQRRDGLIIKRKELEKEIALNFEQRNSKEIDLAEVQCKNAESAVEVSRRRLSDVAGRSGVLVEENRSRSLKRNQLSTALSPLQKRHQTIEENIVQINAILEELETDQKIDLEENDRVHKQIELLDKEWTKITTNISDKKQSLTLLNEEFNVQQRTRIRLESEQTKLEREIARLESRKETLHESRGTSALRLLLDSGIEGIHGLVAQLGEVEDSYRLALEVAAGARMGQVVVDDDRTAAKAIEILKKRRAGRLTFLPLNKLNKSIKQTNHALERFSKGERNIQNNDLIGRAFDLIKFDKLYVDVFEYVFGETLVFSNLTSARRDRLNKRAVTIEGELLEKSGAITGGSIHGRGMNISFGRMNDVDEVEPIRLRLLEIGDTLSSCLKKENTLKDILEKTRSELRALDQRQAALHAERSTFKLANQPLIERQKIRGERLDKSRKEKGLKSQELKILDQEIKPLISNLEELENREKVSNSNDESRNWIKLQEELETADKNLLNVRSERDRLLNEQTQNQLSLERLQVQLKALEVDEGRLKSAVEDLSKAHKDWRQQNITFQERREVLQKQQLELEASFGEKRRERDSMEDVVSKQRQSLQESQWKLDKLKEDRKSLVEEIRNSKIRLEEIENKLPDPLPEIPELIKNNGLKSLQAELELIQKRMEELEPVNMMALDELQKLEERLEDLVQKLQVLTDERSELLLRIETVATLRQEAFMEAFNAVDEHFREIFASLSEGDGHLQLDNSEDPLDGGLTLVAHPKGKPVRRLAAMSGGEKSLTALSFLFALQRFRPSPFYALDEVDSFLDGVNVERLSALIAKQAECAQFLVVSHRRPMIAASNRTIGVTQARGLHTQVVGLPMAA